MKKTLLSIFVIAAFIASTNAQIEIYVNGGATDYSGSTYMAPAQGPGEVALDIHIVNSTGVTKDWVVTRLRINEQATWSDYLCWGHETDPFGGVCYSAGQMSTNPWTSSPTSSVVLLDGEAGILAAHISPDPTAPGTVTYRYYASADGLTFEDSIDVEISFALSVVETTPQFSVNIAPNPSSDYINVNTNGVSTSSLKIVDVLGNIVLRENISGSSKKIDVTRFRNGIYFITLEAEGVKPVTRKVIVRH